MYELLEACGPVVLATSLPADAIAAAASEGRAMHIYIESVMGTQTVRLLQTRDVREIDLVFAVRLGSHDDIRHEPWDTRDDVLRTLGLLPVKGLRRRHRQLMSFQQLRRVARVEQGLGQPVDHIDWTGHDLVPGRAKIRSGYLRGGG